MMRPLNLEEFAQQLRLEGHPFADEILMLVDLEKEVADPYGDLCDDVTHNAPKELKENPTKAAEWLNDRSGELDEIYALFPGVDDVTETIREQVDELENVEEIMRKHGGWTEGDLQDALFVLIERAGKISNDLEYDL